jgi:hypothetical protein
MDNEPQNSNDFDGGNQQRLMEAFGFTEADLLANRAGTVTTRQTQSLHDRYLTALLMIIVLPLGALVIGVVLITNAFGASSRTSWYGVLWIGVGVWYVARNFGKVILLSNAVKQPTVYSVEGMARLERIYSRGKVGFYPYWHYIDVKNVRFEISRQQYDALEHGASYRVYYFGDALTILSVEYISGRRVDTREASTGEGFKRYRSRDKR